jgi:hypothetical protein
MPTASKEVEEDFLEVDQPIVGQNFTCVSFLSPEKVLKKKEEFIFYHYHRCKTLEHESRLKSNMDSLMEKVQDGTVKIKDVVHLKKNMDKGFKLDTISFTEWKEKYEDFLFSKTEEIGKVFDAGNNFQTSIRGVKVRGNYDTYREAEIRAKVLQKKDPLFDVFVGQVGYWLPWSPDTNMMENQEHANEELNTLMKAKKENATERDMFYEERKREMKEAAAKENKEHKQKMEEEQKKLEAELEKKLDSESVKIEELDEDDTPPPNNDEITTNKIDNEELHDILGMGEKKEPVTVGEAVDSLQETDPWLARKQAENTE